MAKTAFVVVLECALTDSKMILTFCPCLGLVLDKASWILKKQKEYREIKPELIKTSFKEDTTLPYFGNNYPWMENSKSI